MQSFITGMPLERMAIDLAGPFHETASGNTFISVVMDYFTKWAEAILVPDHKAATVGNHLIRCVFCKVGLQRYLHSDQGRDFLSNLFDGAW